MLEAASVVDFVAKRAPVAIDSRANHEARIQWIQIALAENTKPGVFKIVLPSPAALQLVLLADPAVYGPANSVLLKAPATTPDQRQTLSAHIATAMKITDPGHVATTIVESRCLFERSYPRLYRVLEAWLMFSLNALKPESIITFKRLDALERFYRENRDTTAAEAFELIDRKIRDLLLASPGDNDAVNKAYDEAIVVLRRHWAAGVAATKPTKTIVKSEPSGRGDASGSIDADDDDGDDDVSGQLSAGEE